jgi:hypothetical protein
MKLSNKSLSILLLVQQFLFCSSDSWIGPPDGWDPKLSGDRVLERLIKVTAPQVKGAHDAEMALVGNRAYIVAEVNDSQPGESAGWHFMYCTMSIVNLETMFVEKILPFARSGQIFENETLPPGACFVPRIIQKDEDTLRCYFCSEQPGKRQSQIWYRDFSLARSAFTSTIHRAKLKTSLGVFDMQPVHFHADAAVYGFKKPSKDYGLHPLDSFKLLDGITYVTLNNFPGKQNALATLNKACNTFEVLGHFNEPQSMELSEAAVQRLPDGTWMAICRQDGGDLNYTFTTSRDGRTWSSNAYRKIVKNGTNSKPTFDRFGGVYYLGWQEATRINNAHRSVFNIDISRNGKKWKRKYRFETDKSFQYPAFREHNGTVWLCVTQGDSSKSRKERILFGKLEHVGKFEL